MSTISLREVKSALVSDTGCRMLGGNGGRVLCLSSRLDSQKVANGIYLANIVAEHSATSFGLTERLWKFSSTTSEGSASHLFDKLKNLYRGFDGKVGKLVLYVFFPDDNPLSDGSSETEVQLKLERFTLCFKP